VSKRLIGASALALGLATGMVAAPASPPNFAGEDGLRVGPDIKLRVACCQAADIHFKT
jgi:hypothetical protein